MKKKIVKHNILQGAINIDKVSDTGIIFLNDM